MDKKEFEQWKRKEISDFDQILAQANQEIRKIVNEIKQGNLSPALKGQLRFYGIQKDAINEVKSHVKYGSRLEDGKIVMIPLVYRSNLPEDILINFVSASLRSDVQPILDAYNKYIYQLGKMENKAVYTTTIPESYRTYFQDKIVTDESSESDLGITKPEDKEEEDFYEEIDKKYIEKLSTLVNHQPGKYAFSLKSQTDRLKLERLVEEKKAAIKKYKDKIEKVHELIDCFDENIESFDFNSLVTTLDETYIKEIYNEILEVKQNRLFSNAEDKEKLHAKLLEFKKTVTTIYLNHLIDMSSSVAPRKVEISNEQTPQQKVIYTESNLKVAEQDLQELEQICERLKEEQTKFIEQSLQVRESLAKLFDEKLSKRDFISLEIRALREYSFLTSINNGTFDYIKGRYERQVIKRIEKLNRKAEKKSINELGTMLEDKKPIIEESKKQVTN